MKARQLDLFSRDTHPALPVHRELGDVPPPLSEWVELARALPSFLRLGTSSWTFPGWKGVVYRRKYPNERAFMQRSLEEYARVPLFRTVGIDRSFWSPIPEQDLRSYAAQMPEGFRCVMKVWEELTTVSYASHPRYGERAGQLNPNFLDVDVFVRDVYEPVKRTLGARLSAFVFEIPPPPKLPDRRSFERVLGTFFSRAPRDLPFAVELRDRRLLTPRHLDLLREHHVTHVLNQWSRMPSLGEQLEVCGAHLRNRVIARLMLPENGDFEERHQRFAPFDRVVEVNEQTRQDVKRLVERAREQGVEELHVIVSNNLEGSSPATIMALARMLAAT